MNEDLKKLLDEDEEATPVIPKSLANWTIVNLLPWPLRESKTNMIPGYFTIPKARGDKFGLLSVGESIHWQEQPFPNMPPIKVVTPAREMAKSIVTDYVDGFIGIGPDAMPGLFCLEGHLNQADVMLHHKVKLTEAQQRQKRWFVNLVKVADDDWARFHQHKVISDTQRLAARELGLEREWLALEMDKIMDVCPFCKSQVRQDAIVCAQCKEVVKPEEYKKLHVATVGDKGVKSAIAG